MSAATETETVASSVRTAPALLSAQATSRATMCAVRVLESGVWVEYSWSDLARTVARVASLFDEAGVAAGSSVAVVSGSRAEWAVSVWAAQSLGATVVAVSSQVDAEALTALAGLGPEAWVLEGLEAWDRMTQNVPGAKNILVLDDIALNGGRTPDWVWSRDIVGADEARDDRRIEALGQRAAQVDPATVALVLASDGGRSYTHTDLLGAAATASAGSPLPLIAADEYLSFLPPTWPDEALALAGAHVVSGATVSYGSRSGGGLAEVAAVRPTVIQGPAVWWDAVNGHIRRLAEEPAPLGRAPLTAILAGESGGGFLTRAVRRVLLRRIGLDRLRHGRSVGAPADATVSLLAGLGIALEIQPGPVTGGADTPDEGETT